MEAQSLTEVRRRLQAGEVIAFPTETFFGLGVDPLSKPAVETLLTLKNRPPGEGIPLIADTAERVISFWPLATDDASRYRRSLQDTFWPGPLTVILPALPHTPRFAEGIYGPGRTVAVRVSSQPAARDIAAAAAGLITATSANPRGEQPPRSAEIVRRYFPNLYVYGENSGDAELPSTIIDVTAWPFRIIREGAVSFSRLNEVLDGRLPGPHEGTES